MHVYVYVLYGTATANGEVGISGSRSSPCQMSPISAHHRGSRDSNRFHPVHVVNNFKFQFQICALAAALKISPAVSLVLSMLVPGYLYGTQAIDRTLLPPFGRSSSTLVSSVSLRACPGSQYLILGVPSDNR
jgi:hypothetical protein